MRRTTPIILLVAVLQAGCLAGQDHKPGAELPTLSLSGYPSEGYGAGRAMTAMSSPLPRQSVPYSIIGRYSVTEAWDGAPLRLLENQSANMPETPNGTMILTYTNQAQQNNLGQIAITSGGSAPVFKNLPALINQPGFWINNWQANNLSITNVSANDNTPILVQAVGSGMPGISPLDLPIGGQGINLILGQCAQGNASPQWMQLVIRSSSSTLGIIAIIGGPPDTKGNNGYVVAVNAGADTGPDGPTPPAGYYATTTGNTYQLPFNWGSSTVFVANLSPSTANPVNVLMRTL